MEIQWFPGHMYKAKRDIAGLIGDIDIVIELLDARSPFASMNPLLQSIIKHKKNIKILNKSDLADPQTTKLWLDFFNSQKSTKAIPGSLHNPKQKNTLIKTCRSLSPARGSFEKPIRVMVSGIPNVGKSSLINQLLGKKSAKTGDIPAVTKTNQCLKLDDGFLIYDTPGITWQKFVYPQIGYNLALCNSIGKNALDEETISLYLIEYLTKHYQEALSNRYKIVPIGTQLASDILSQIGKKRGCILSGGVIDVQKASEILIQDFRGGKLGKISLETPDLWQIWQQSVAPTDLNQSLLAIDE